MQISFHLIQDTYSFFSFLNGASPLIISDCFYWWKHMLTNLIATFSCWNFSFLFVVVWFNFFRYSSDLLFQRFNKNVITWRSSFRSIQTWFSLPLTLLIYWTVYLFSLLWCIHHTDNNLPTRIATTINQFNNNIYAFLFVNVTKYKLNDKTFKTQLYFDSYKSSADWQWNEKV